MEETLRADTPAIVLVRLSALGDVAMTIPAIYDLCQHNPGSRVVLVTRRWMAKMFVNAPSNLTVEGIDPAKDFKGIRGIYRLSKELRAKYHIKAFIDLHDVLRTRLLRNFMRLSGVPVTVIDKGRKEKRKLSSQGAKKYFSDGKEPLMTTIDRYYDAIERAGFPIKKEFECLFAPSAPEHGTTRKKRIGVAPFAAHKGKIYPLELMAEVVATLAKKDNTEIYLFGAGDSECAILEEWSKGRPNVINMAARKSGLTAELELMSTLDVMLSMDSANMHLASIAGTPRCVSIWGATHPAAGFTPHRANPDDIIGIDMPCRPCSVYGNKPCRFRDTPCLRRISPDTVLKALDRP